MAPPEQRFPVGDLELRVQSHTVDFKEKSRKLGNFDLKSDCELLELVQYSCTTPEQQYRRAIESPDGKARMECFPFVRLFRKCQKNGKVFHVETTAWEGEHAWNHSATAQPATVLHTNEKRPADSESLTDSIANYAKYFWTGK